MPNEEPDTSRGAGGSFASGLREQPSISPVDGRVMGWYPVARPEDVARLGARLRVEGEAWAELPLQERLRKIAPLRRLLAERAEPLAEILALEIGRPVVEGYAAEILPTLQALNWLHRHAEGVLRPQRSAGMSRRQRQEWRPYGVIGLISPWNYPLFLSLPVIAAALAAGNVVLWKPSDLALATAHEVRLLLEEAGLGHLVAVAPGDAAVGMAVVDAACDKYVFIGGEEAGREVLAELGCSLKPAVAELSSADPMLVCADADIGLAARAAVWGRVLGAGQTCMAPKRIFVHHGIYARFLEAAEDTMAAVRMSDPRQPETELGPLRTAEAREAARAIVEEALAGGARLACGGGFGGGSGFYMRPTLLADCRTEMRVMREDVFAPIVAVAPVAGVEEAIRHANALSCGLTASVWTRNPQTGRSVAARLKGGVVTVNDVVLPGASPAAPFGGAGDSGFGRVRGAAGLLEMVQPCVVDRGPNQGAPYRHLLPYRSGTLDMLRALTVLETASGLTRLAAMRGVVRAALRYGR